IGVDGYGMLIFILQVTYMIEICTIPNKGKVTVLVFDIHYISNHLAVPVGIGYTGLGASDINQPNPLQGFNFFCCRVVGQDMHVISDFLIGVFEGSVPRENEYGKEEQYRCVAKEKKSSDSRTRPRWLFCCCAPLID